MFNIISIILLFLFSSANASWYFANDSISRDKLEAPQYWLGTPIIYTTATPTPIPTLPVVSTGKPLLITMQGIASESYSLLNTASPSPAIGSVKLFRGATQINEGSTIRSINANYKQESCFLLSFIDSSPPVGVIEYSVSFHTSNASSPYEIHNCRLVVYEL